MFRKNRPYPYSGYVVNTGALYDFLFDNDYAAPFCNIARDTYSSAGTRRLKDFILRLHTGETLAFGTPDWSIEERQKLGQRYIKDLAEDVLQEHAGKTFDERNLLFKALLNLVNGLELDGYIFNESVLLEPEQDILDAEEESNVLKVLYTSLNLENKATTFHHLALSEDHYISGNWDDSISNSRKFLESVLQEVASQHHYDENGTYLSDNILSKPFKVRNYLEREGLLDSKEMKAIAEVYGLLSETGGHPYMASNDQARLLRHLSLTFSQFIMLRLKGLQAAKET